MEKVIVSDTTCLIILTKIGALDLLERLFSKVIITDEVSKEFNELLPIWIIVEQVQNRSQVEVLQLLLDLGESSSIALCVEKKNCLLIIDERKGRKVAQDLNIPIIGTLGILLEAKKSGLIHSIRPLFEELLETNFRISKQLLNVVLEQVGELPFN